MATKRKTTEATAKARARRQARERRLRNERWEREVNAAAQVAKPMTKGERIRAYLRSPEGQAKLREIKDGLDSCITIANDMQQSIRAFQAETRKFQAKYGHIR